MFLLPRSGVVWVFFVCFLSVFFRVFFVFVWLFILSGDGEEILEGL